MRQETLTVVARVDDIAGLTHSLSLLAEDRVGGDGPRAFQPRLFENPALGIHFARLAAISSQGDPRFSDWLAFESNFDTRTEDPDQARKEHLAQLAELARDGLDMAFRHCERFPSTSAPADFAQYWQSCLVPASASYQGHVERDLARIRLEQRLREVILTFLENVRSAPKAELFKQIRDHVRFRSKSDAALSGFDVDASPPSMPDPQVRSQRLKEGYLPWIVNIAPALPLLGELPNIYAWQKKDVELDYQAQQEAWTAADRKRFADVAATEDHGIQNALTHIVPLRDGEGREGVLRAAHAYIDRMAKQFFDDIGQLGGIPSIHFAKWLLLDEGRRLMFFSNYDSSWESYLGDFVDQAAIGLNLAWSCCENYPKTQFLGWGGADDEERFKAWGRAYQQPTQVFYSAYPELSIAAINNNTWIRHGLQSRPSASQISAWFRRLT